jgi:hypothetical protein
MKLEFSVDLINGVLAYLEKQPYADVAKLITTIHAEAAEAQNKNTPPTIPQVISPEQITEVVKG